MKALAALATGVVLVFLAIVLAPAPASTGPVPVRHGHDACASCRMQVDRAGFAAEWRRDGRVLIFDDLGCLAHALASGGDRSDVWVEDHESGELVPLVDATLVQPGNQRTPMGSGVVAYRDRRAASARGPIVTIERLIAAARGEVRS